MVAISSQLLETGYAPSVALCQESRVGTSSANLCFHDDIVLALAGHFVPASSNPVANRVARRVRNLTELHPRSDSVFDICRRIKKC